MRTSICNIGGLNFIKPTIFLALSSISLEVCFSPKRFNYMWVQVSALPCSKMHVYATDNVTEGGELSLLMVETAMSCAS